MNPQRRFAPIGGLFKPESVAGLARIRKGCTPFRSSLKTDVMVYIISMIIWESLYLPVWSVFFFLPFGILLSISRGASQVKPSLRPGIL